MNVYLALLLGLVCAGAGGELFVHGTIGLAKAARISPNIIAATVAAFATSCPELTVGINSALEGTPQISLGDVVGSNVVNVALILGAGLLVAPIKAPRDSVKRDFPGALLVPIILGVLLLDGRISRFDGIILLSGFAIWLGFVVYEALRQRGAAGEALAEAKPIRAILESATGLALLIAAGRLIVSGATGIAQAYGVSQFVIGATIVAVGTSIPELATAIISQLRGYYEVGLGTILGSNIFNSLFIVGVTSMITPITVSFKETVPVLILGLAAVVLTFPPRSGIIKRWRGGMLLAVYALYVATVLLGSS